MGRNRYDLNPKQIEVLEWVRVGCPPDRYPSGYQHRITARALSARGLVSISGSGTTWTAQVTEAGEAWQSPKPSPTESDPIGDQFQRVIDAGGRLALPHESVTRRFRELVEGSLASPRRPSGKKLALESGGSMTNPTTHLILVDYFDDEVTTEPVHVPRRVAQPHSLIAAYMDNREWTYITPEHVPRAIRILQAIVQEAEWRGMEIVNPSPLSTEQARVNRVRRKSSVVFEISIDQRRYPVWIKELSRKGGAAIPPTGGPAKSPLWRHERHWVFLSSGRLEIRCGAMTFKDERWTTLEDKLPELFRQLLIADHDQAIRDAARQRELESRQERWEAAMAKATESYYIGARYERFKVMSDKWETIQRRRAFLEAARGRLSDYEGAERAAVAAELDFAEEQINKLEPLANLSQLDVAIAEPRPEDLRPHLGRWSPYGANAPF